MKQNRSRSQIILQEEENSKIKENTTTKLHPLLCFTGNSVPVNY